MIKKIWHDPVWSKVIATGIIAAAGGFAVYFLDLWSTIWQFFLATYGLAISSTSLPNWFISLICLLSLPTFYLIFRKIYPNNRPGWQDYKTDEFFGIVWRWSYNSEGEIVNLASFCPHCDFQIYAFPVSDYNRFLGTSDQIVYYCDACKKKIGESHNESVYFFENKIKRSIQLKIRNNNWVSQTKKI